MYCDFLEQMLKKWGKGYTKINSEDIEREFSQANPATLKRVHFFLKRKNNVEKPTLDQILKKVEKLLPNENFFC